MAKTTKEILAAGSVVFRRGPDGQREVLLVHRPRYDDWSLPKGKLDPDEYLAACAVRETREETSVRVRLGLPVDKIRYPISTGMKTVHYWRGQLDGEQPHVPSDEVDEVAWLSITQALRQVSYPDERAILRQAVELPDSTPLVIVRHAKAMLRANWGGRDVGRPLDERGRRQARALVPLLDAYGIRRLASSSANRCLRTLQPHAKAHRLEVEGWSVLTEEQGTKDPAAVSTLVRRLAQQTADTGTPLAICGHRPVLPAMLDALGVPTRALPPAAAVVLHLGPDAKLQALEVHKSRL